MRTLGAMNIVKRAQAMRDGLMAEIDGSMLELTAAATAVSVETTKVKDTAAAWRDEAATLRSMFEEGGNGVPADEPKPEKPAQQGGG